MRISDWSSDVCSSDLDPAGVGLRPTPPARSRSPSATDRELAGGPRGQSPRGLDGDAVQTLSCSLRARGPCARAENANRSPGRPATGRNHLAQPNHAPPGPPCGRSEEHTSELQSLMRSSYAVFCLKTKNNDTTKSHH